MFVTSPWDFGRLSVQVANGSSVSDNRAPQRTKEPVVPEKMIEQYRYMLSYNGMDGYVPNLRPYEVHIHEDRQ